jgi:hypothetical protein
MSAPGAHADIASARCGRADDQSEYCRRGTTGKHQKPPAVLPDESRPSRKNIFLSVNRKQAYIHAVPPARGAFRDRHDSWVGMRWTRCVARRAARCVRSSRVVLIPRRWDQADGVIHSRRGLTSPVPRGEHGAAVKPLRRECRSDFGVPVLACVRLFHFCTQGNGCGAHPAFPAPSVFRRDENDASLGRRSRRGNAEGCLKVESERPTGPDHLAPLCGES